MSLENFLAEQLLTLRYIAPNANIQLPQSLEEQQLLSDLLALPDDRNPVKWLKENRFDLSVQLTLLWVLKRIDMFTIGMRQAQAVGNPISEMQQQLLGYPLKLTNELDTLKDMGKQSLPSLDQLQLILQQIKKSLQIPVGTPAPKASQPYQQLITDLIFLPNETNVSTWLKNNAQSIVPIISLNYVLENPIKRPQSLGKPIKSVRIRGAIYTSKLLIIPNRIEFNENGGFLTANILIWTMGLVKNYPNRLEETQFLWRGFNRLEDNKGNCYFLRMENANSHNLFLVSRERLKMVFYPNIPQDVSTLNFVAPSTVLSIETTKLDKDVSSVAEIPLGNVNLRVKTLKQSL